MAKKQVFKIGVEFDAVSLRVVKIATNGSGVKNTYSLIALYEQPGDFSVDEELLGALRKAYVKLGITESDIIVSCLSGKQIYAAQQNFRRLPADEMIDALKLEIRKNLSFDVAAATVDFHILDGTDEKAETVPLIVAAAANSLLSRHLELLKRAQIKPEVVEVLPLAVANTFWLCHPRSGAVEGHMVLHMGPEVTTLVLVGELSPFFHRNLYFNAYELIGEHKNEKLTTLERDRKISAFLEEVMRSLSYYETSHRSATFSSINVMGNFSDPVLCTLLTEKTGLPVVPLDVVAQINETGTAIPPGKFDLAVALAMR